MLVPVKKLTIITLADLEEELLLDLGKLGVVQLKRLSEDEFLGFKKVPEEELRKYEELLDRFNNLYNSLCPGCKIPYKKFTMPKRKEDPVEIEKEISQYESKLAYITTELSRNEQRIKSLKSVKLALKILKKCNINPQEIGTFAHLFSIIGIMNKKYAEELKEKFSKFSQVILKIYEYTENEVVIFLTSLIELQPQIRKILMACEFNELKIPPEVPPRIEDALQWVDDEIRKSQSEIADLRQQKELLRNEFLENAYILRKKITLSYKLCLAQTHLLRSKLMIVLQGWLPEDKISEITKFLEDTKKRVEGKILYYFEDPSPNEEVPTVLRNPKMFRAYESLIRQYGTPVHYEYDPTMVGGILWTIMFGLMFPDYGEGFVIFLLGIIFSYALKRKTIMGVSTKKLGNLMMGMGISAIFFGLLIGEFFLTEVEPLWPGLSRGWIEEPYYILWLLKIAVFFGIAEIIIGMLLNIQQNLKYGHKVEAIFGEHGLAGLIGFLGIVILAFSFVGIRVLPPLTLPFPLFGVSKLPAIDFPEADIGSLLNIILNFPKYWYLLLSPASLGELLNLQRNWGIFFSLMLIAIALCAMLYRSIIEKEGIVLGFSIVYEAILSFITNMLSFARIAGFFIAHAALAMVVMKLLEHNLILGIGMGLIFLNAFALTLELVVVMIQATRLLFYEFLTKFYEGSGETFKPFRL